MYNMSLLKIKQKGNFITHNNTDGKMSHNLTYMESRNVELWGIIALPQYQFNLSALYFGVLFQRDSTSFPGGLKSMWAFISVLWIGDQEVANTWSEPCPSVTGLEGHTCNPSTSKMKQEDWEFKASIDYTQDLLSKKVCSINTDNYYLSIRINFAGGGWLSSRAISKRAMFSMHKSLRSILNTK